MYEDDILINGLNFTIKFAIDKEVVRQRIEDGLPVLLISYFPNPDEHFTQEHCENRVNDSYKDIILNAQSYIDSDVYKDYTFSKKLAYVGLIGRNGGFQQYVNQISFAID